MHDDPESRERESSEDLHVWAVKIALEKYRTEILMAAGFFESDADAAELLYLVVRESERRYARDHGVDPRALVMEKRLREMLVGPGPDLGGSSADDSFLNEIVAEAERRRVRRIIGVDLFVGEDGTDSGVIRRRPRRRPGEEDEPRAG